MSAKGFTLDDLIRILRAAAGADESIDLDGDIIDASFEELGYESLALLETGSRIEREYGIQLSDDDLIETSTVRDLLSVVNNRLSSVPTT